jgi:hypothetical protein
VTAGAALGDVAGGVPEQAVMANASDAANARCRRPVM